MRVLEIKTEFEKAVKNITIPTTVIVGDQEMDWEYTLPQKHIPDLMGYFQARLLKLTLVLNQSEAGDSAASAYGETHNREAQAAREGTIPPAIPGATLGASQSAPRPFGYTGKGNGVAGGSGGGLPPRGPPPRRHDDSFSDSDSDPSDDEGQPKKKRLTSRKLLKKYITTMVKDYQ